MALLRETSTGKTLLLEPEHLIGRALTCSLRLRAGYVSSQHAVVRWVDRQWEVKDLGSSNGTFIDGRRIEHGMSSPIVPGAKLAFGQAQEQWELVDASEPQAMVVPIENDGAEPIVAEGDLLALPSADDPVATIYAGPGGVWLLEQESEPPAPLINQQPISVAGRWWRFCCVEMGRSTTRLQEGAPAFSLADLALDFAVSRDETFVQVHLRASGRTIDLGARTFNYLLVTLARRRQADERRGLPDTSCGWIDKDELADGLEVTPQQVNIEVFRLRRHLAQFGVADAVNTIERRVSARQLRIGTRKVAITVV
jgi:hypothetical protein